METKKWINRMYASDALCEEYMAKIRNAKSKRQLFDIAVDANGIDYLCEMRDNGHPLPYDVIEGEFKPYLNGRYIAEIPCSIGAYTSALYIGLGKTDEVNMGTTLACFMNCQCVIRIKDYHAARIVLDENCDVKIICPQSSNLIVECWGNSRVEYEGYSHIRVKRMGGKRNV